MKKILLAIAVLAIALVSLPSASFAYGGDAPEVTQPSGNPRTFIFDYPASTFSFGEGVSVVITCTSGDATVVSDPTDLFADETGAFSFEFLAPEGDYGSCSVELVGLTSGFTYSSNVAYVPPVVAPTEDGGGIAYTGLNAGLLASLGFGLGALGLVFFIVRSRRRRAAEAASRS